MKNNLNKIYASTKVCEDNAKTNCLALEPEISKIFTESRDYNKLLHFWESWHDLTGNKMRDIYTETVKLENKKARENNFHDLSELWIEDFEDKNFESDIDQLYSDILPFYKNLHAYVRRVLFKTYGKNYPSTHKKSMIPGETRFLIYLVLI